MTAQSGVYAQTSNESTAFTFRAEDGDKRFIFYFDKDISSMFSKILEHLPKYTVSSSKKCNLHIHWYENLKTHEITQNPVKD